VRVSDRPAAGSPTFSVVIPVYNEEKLVAEAAGELCAALDARGWDYELLLCENGSKDRTAELVDGLAAAHPRVRALHETEPNYGRALRHGILEARGKYVICDEIDLCDVDFYDRAVPLLESDEAELVVGSKVLAGAKDERPLVRHAATLVINGMLRASLGFQGTDTHGLKAFRREALVDVARACVVEKDLFASEFVIRAGRMGRRVREIPIVVREKRRPSINLVRRVPNVLRNLARLVWVIRVKNR
jgi:glycosyltransferase involved in cell wall biosynthesis